MTPSGTPRPMPILAEALGPLGGGVGEVGCVVEKTDVEEVGRVDACKDEEVDMGEEVDSREVVSVMTGTAMGKDVDMLEEVHVGEETDVESTTTGKTVGVVVGPASTTVTFPAGTISGAASEAKGGASSTVTALGTSKIIVDGAATSEAIAEEKKVPLRAK